MRDTGLPWCRKLYKSGSATCHHAPKKASIKVTFSQSQIYTDDSYRYHGGCPCIQTVELPYYFSAIWYNHLASFIYTTSLIAWNMNLKLVVWLSMNDAADVAIRARMWSRNYGTRRHSGFSSTQHVTRNTSSFFFALDATDRWVSACTPYVHAILVITVAQNFGSAFPSSLFTHTERRSSKAKYCIKRLRARHHLMNAFVLTKYPFRWSYSTTLSRPPIVGVVSEMIRILGR